MTIKRVPIQAPVSGVTPEQLTVTSQNSEEARRAIGNIEKRFTDDAALVWDDLRADVRQGDASAALTWEQLRDTGFILGHMRHDQADTVYFVYQMPHRWAKTEVRPHLHFLPLAAPASPPENFVLIVRWMWIPYNEEAYAISKANWMSKSVVHKIYASNLNRHQIVSFGRILPADGCKESSILLLSARRNAGVDTYTDSKGYGTNAANIALLSGDLHFQVEKSGTKMEF